MLVFVAALFIMGVTMIAGVLFLVWVFRQANQAANYRRLLLLHSLIPKEELAGAARAHTSNAPRYRITYKNGRKQESITVEAKSEGEALQKFMATPQGNGKIVNLEKL